METRRTIYLILGAGIAGMGAAYALRQRGHEALVLEKDQTYGGLCGYFEKDGFRFDRFVHFSFTEEERVNAFFRNGAPEVWHHPPVSYNFYHGTWIKHPAQNNLYPLDELEKERIINDFLHRKPLPETPLHDYEQWLRLQYGDYFAEHFPMVYTRKYWMREACQLETGWIGRRLYRPSVEEVIRGSRDPGTPSTYYAKEMRYPKCGGFKQFLSGLAREMDVCYGAKVSRVNARERIVETEDGRRFGYKRLVSTLPLPEIIRFLQTVPDAVRAASEKLACTCGYQVSIGLKGRRIPPYLWWYIYDEENLAARVYSPSLKSPDNVPEGCTSLQMEVYCPENSYTKETLLERTLGHLLRNGILHEEDVLFADVRFEPYANVIFDHGIEGNRRIVRDYLASQGIVTAGRFGEWDYLWSDQSLLSGLDCIIEPDL